MKLCICGYWIDIMGSMLFSYWDKLRVNVGCMKCGIVVNNLKVL